jgi:signal transduction histidine kinase
MKLIKKGIQFTVFLLIIFILVFLLIEALVFIEFKLRIILVLISFLALSYFVLKKLFSSNKNHYMSSIGISFLLMVVLYLHLDMWAFNARTDFETQSAIKRQLIEVESQKIMQIRKIKIVISENNDFNPILLSIYDYKTTLFSYDSKGNEIYKYTSDNIDMEEIERHINEILWDYGLEPVEVDFRDER